MLAKIMKYDLRKMFKILIYLYIIAIVCAGITRFINIWNDIQFVFILGHVFAGITYSAIGSVLVNTFVHILKAFTDGFYKDESYLTHTLPVNKNKLLLSKFICSIIVVLASVAVCALSLVIMFFSQEFFEMLKIAIESIVAGFNMPVWLFLVLIALLIFAQICCMITMAFTAIVKANTYNSKRLLKGFLWFAVFYFGSANVSLLVFALIFAITGNINELLATVMSQSSFTLLLVAGLILYVIYVFLFYFICNKLFNKGVNVD